VLGGAQSLHTNSLDEAYALPSEHAATLALRTQQAIAYESGIPAVPDPFGGSYFVENLTQQLADSATATIGRIDQMGGMIPAIEKGYPQSEIAQASYAYQRTVETGEQVVVGVNRFRNEQETPLEVLKIARDAEQAQRRKLAALRASRNNEEVSRRLLELRRAAEGGTNLMPILLDAVRVYATLGEICSALRDVFGTWDEVNAT